MYSTTPRYQRFLALCLSAVLTLGMLGGIDHLAQPDQAEGQWAKAGPHTTAAAKA